MIAGLLPDLAIEIQQYVLCRLAVLNDAEDETENRNRSLVVQGGQCAHLTGAGPPEPVCPFALFDDQEHKSDSSALQKCGDDTDGFFPKPSPKSIVQNVTSISKKGQAGESTVEIWCFVSGSRR